jgi:hypothetical protein
MQRNWMKMYNKEGTVLRVETEALEELEVRAVGHVVSASTVAYRAVPACPPNRLQGLAVRS